MKQNTEAAEMYVLGEQYERAATIYLSEKAFSKATPLMDHITTPKLHALMAKAKEADKQWEVSQTSKTAIITLLC